MLTGCLLDRVESRKRDAEECAYIPRSSSRTLTVQQPIAWIQNQRNFGSCTGQAVAACVNAHVANAPWCSAVGLWRGARWRQRREYLKDYRRGSRIEYAITELIKRGWEQFREGEDRDITIATSYDIEDELFSHDKRLRPTIVRYRVIKSGADRVDAIHDALDQGLYVVFSAFLRSPFFNYRPRRGENHILTEREIGGTKDLHAMRAFAGERKQGRRTTYWQNSWGTGWGGAFLPNGTWHQGICEVDEGVLGNTGAVPDVHVFQIQPR